MKIFISQPMRGKTNEQIKEERAELVKELQEQGNYVLDTIFDLGKSVSPIIYLAKSIEVLDKADAVVFMPGWESARGCVIEYEIALKYGKYIKEIQSNQKSEVSIPSIVIDKNSISIY